MGGALAEWQAGTGALLFGRRTWQTMAAAWPARAGDPFADHMNSVTKYVVSSTLGEDELTWNNTTCIPGDQALDRIKKLREAEGRDLVVMGSASLTRTLLAEGLVDELRLMILPVLVGGGKSIYPTDGHLRTFELVSTVVSGTGVHVCTYRPKAGAWSAGPADLPGSRCPLPARLGCGRQPQPHVDADPGRRGHRRGRPRMPVTAG